MALNLQSDTEKQRRLIHWEVWTEQGKGDREWQGDESTEQGGQVVCALHQVLCVVVSLQLKVGLS